MPTYDLTLFGATGFTGNLVARYLAPHAGKTRIALAGRDARKLDAVKRAMVAIAPEAESVGLVTASLDDTDALRKAAEDTRVLVTTVGPYASLGAPALQAAVEGGCDYVDITGEPHFVRRSIENHHAHAAEKGLRIIHCGGFDSVPHDVGAYETAKALEGAKRIKINGYVRANGSASGGTWNSFIDAMTSIRDRADVKLPLHDHPGRTIATHPARLGWNEHLHGWATPLPTIDPQIVLRSASAFPVYGTQFSYAHHALIKSTLTLVGGAIGLGTLLAATQIPPLRPWLKNLRPSGDGPSPERRARSWFRCVFVGEGDGRRVETIVSGKDPGYDETAKMLSECALALIHDRAELPAVTGVLTPVAALGDALTARLRASGITVETRNLQGSAGS